MLEEKKVFLAILAPCLAAGWWIYTLTEMSFLTQHCYEPYPSYGLLVYFGILVVIIPAAFLVICVVAFLIFFCPCITWIIGRAFFDRRERSLLKERVI